VGHVAVAGSLAPCKECPDGWWSCQDYAIQDSASTLVLTATADVAVDSRRRLAVGVVAGAVLQHPDNSLQIQLLCYAAIFSQNSLISG
jgi:hypothetical protein